MVGILEMVKRLAANRRAAVKVGENTGFNRLLVRAGAGDVIRIGDNSQVHARLRTDRSPAYIDIGSRTFIGRSLIIAADRVSIGDDVLISWDVTIVDHDSHALDFEHRRNDVLAWSRGEKDWTHVTVAPVRIEHKTWIGFGATILKGVTVGEGAAIGAKSVVTRDVPPWTVAVGSPARVIKSLPRPEGARS